MNQCKFYYSCRFTLLLFLLITVFKIQSGFSQTKQERSLEYYIRHAPFHMPDIPEPKIPERTCNITDYGAKGHGSKLNTQAIQHAINACAKAGGGKVIIPPGLWLTGPIELKSNINLHLDRGGILLFTKDHTQYPIIKWAHSDDRYEVMPPIYGHDLTNVAITGGGVIDGNGQSWRPVKKEKVTEEHWNQLLDSGGVLNADHSIWWPSKSARDGEQYIDSLKSQKKNLTAKDYLPARNSMRPYMVVILYSKNVLIDGPIFRNSPKFSLYPQYCINVIIRNVRVYNAYWAQNGDGIDIEGGRNIAIYNNTVTAGDDGICMKSSPTDDKMFSGPALKNVIIADNVVHHGHGGFVIGSNTDGGIQNIFVTNCDFIGTDRGLRFKSDREDGGSVHDIYIKNIYMTRIVKQAIYFNTYYDLPDNGKKTYQPVSSTTPKFQDFHISNIYCDGATTAVSMTGLPEMPIQDVYLSNIRIKAKRGFYADEVKNIKMNHVTIIPETKTIYSLNNARNIVMSNMGVPDSLTTYLKLTGKKTSNIVVKNTKLPQGSKVIHLGPKVKKGVLKLNANI
jgi:polygalacturonase